MGSSLVPSKYLQGPALRGQHQPTFVLCAAPPPRPSFEEILQSLEELRAAEGGATTRLEVRCLNPRISLAMHNAQTLAGGGGGVEVGAGVV